MKYNDIMVEFGVIDANRYCKGEVTRYNVEPIGYVKQTEKEIQEERQDYNMRHGIFRNERAIEL